MTRRENPARPNPRPITLHVWAAHGGTAVAWDPPPRFDEIAMTFGIGAPGWTPARRLSDARLDGFFSAAARYGYRVRLVRGPPPRYNPPRPSVDALITDFRRRPDATRCLTARGARNACSVMSVRFVTAAQARGFYDAAVVQVDGLRYGPSEADIAWGAEHTVVKIGRLYYDWTFRQIESTAPVPAVFTLSELHELWAEVWHTPPGMTDHPSYRKRLPPLRARHVEPPPGRAPRGSR